MNPNKTKSVDDVISELRNPTVFNTDRESLRVAADYLHRAKVMSEAITLLLETKYIALTGTHRKRLTEALAQFKGDAK